MKLHAKSRRSWILMRGLPFQFWLTQSGKQIMSPLSHWMSVLVFSLSVQNPSVICWIKQPPPQPPARLKGIPVVCRGPPARWLWLCAFSLLVLQGQVLECSVSLIIHYRLIMTAALLLLYEASIQTEWGPADIEGIVLISDCFNQHVRGWHQQTTLHTWIGVCCFNWPRLCSYQSIISRLYVEKSLSHHIVTKANYSQYVVSSVVKDNSLIPLCSGITLLFKV